VIFPLLCLFPFFLIEVLSNTSHVAKVIDEGRVVFEKNGANNIIKQVCGGGGFVLKETIGGTRERRRRQDMYNKGGGFLPVWFQGVCWVDFE
jgi:hypothetical protein